MRSHVIIIMQYLGASTRQNGSDHEIVFQLRTAETLFQDDHTVSLA